MEIPSTTKTEQRAVNALEGIIDQHLAMTHQFNGNDKEMSWDGYIWLYKKNSTKQSKQDFDGRVPVQIKGHNDQEHKYINSKKISYPVDIGDLKAYATEKGVLYFLVFIDGSRQEIFYSSLYPSKIADYLDEIEKKGNSSTYNITFIKLEKNPEKLYIIAKQFDAEAKKQGSSYTPLVKDRIKSEDFGKIKSLNLTVVGAKDPYNVLKRLPSGDICLYGKTEDDKYHRPIQFLENIKFIVGRTIHQDVSIGGEVFYNSYNCITDSDGVMTIVLSPNLEISVKEGKFKFKPKTTLEKLCHDARFLIKLGESNSFNIGNSKLNLLNPRFTNGLEEWLKYIIDLYKVLKMIGLGDEFELLKCSTQQEEQLSKLVNLYNKLCQKNQLDNALNKYDWMFGDKYVPLLIVKQDNKVEFTSAIYTNKIYIFLSEPEKKAEQDCRMPLFAYQSLDVLSNLYFYDYDVFYSQIDSSDINEVTSGELLNTVLLLINTFDKNNDFHFLDIAEYLLKKIKPFISKNELIVLNTFQIKKRRDTLDEKDLEVLHKIKSSDKEILFGISVLLNEKEKAEYYFNEFSEEIQKRYKEYPIYKLFSQMK